MADVYFQASLVAERMGHWVLARSYAERAKAYCEQLNDERNVGRLLNNLGGLNFQLGKPERRSRISRRLPRAARQGQRRRGGQRGLVARARAPCTGQVQAAEEEARHALELLEDREDFLVDIAPPSSCWAGR
jgi:hypothetical protein